MSLKFQELLNGFITRTNRYLHKYNIDHNYMFSPKHIVKYSELLETSDWGNWKEFIENLKPVGNTYKKYRLYTHPQNKYEIDLVDWNDCSTFINTHIKRSCFIKVLSGSLTNERYTIYKDGIMKTKTTLYSGPNDICYNHEQLGFHKLIGSKDAYSLHVYFPAIQRT